MEAARQPAQDFLFTLYYTLTYGPRIQSQYVI